MSNEPAFLRSYLAEKFLYLDGKKFTLKDGYGLYEAVYDGDYPWLLLKNARQTGKTVTVANFISLNSAFRSNYKSLYISPSEGQTTRFSHTKLGKVISGSPVIRKIFAGDTNNVYLKVTKTGSEVALSYASADPDRIRGVSADFLAIDEIQDLSLPEVLTVAGSCTDASLDPRISLSGTPKTLENPFETYWKRSSQTEALIKCTGCNMWNMPTEKNIGRLGFICAKCGKLLNVRNYIWRDFNKKYNIKGFHIPQIIIPLHTENINKWKILLDKYETWPRSKFNNEIMALSDSVGSRSLERDDLEARCSTYNSTRIPNKEVLKDCEFVVAGIDHGGLGKENISRTVVSVFGVTSNLKMKMLYYKIYPIEDPVKSVEDIIEILHAYNTAFVIGDNGEGALANSLIAEKLGKHRVGRFFYGSFSRPIELDTVTGIYKLDKTTVIDNYFKFIKDGGMVFPTSADCKLAFDDIMNEFSEVTKTGKKIWTHGADSPDDCLHSHIGAWIAFKILKRNLSFF